VSTEAPIATAGEGFPRDRSLEEANKDLIRRVEAAWEADDFETLERLFDPEMVTNASVPYLPEGFEGWKAAHLQMRRAVPDRKVTIEDILAEGDRVAVRCRLRGTNVGGFPWAGAEGNGRPIDMQWLGIYRIRDGRVVEHFAINDMTTLVHQVGAPDALIDRRVRRGGWPFLGDRVGLDLD
jgi:predicted ester cyclase